jgi:hypothetical protein
MQSKTRHLNPATAERFPAPAAEVSTIRIATPAFREWFRGSVVVNPDGTPRVMYHGSATAKIDAFMSERLQGWDRVSGWFAFDPRFAATFAGSMGRENQLYPVFLRCRKMFDIRDPADRAAVVKASEELGVVSPALRWERNKLVETDGFGWDDLEASGLVRLMKEAGFDSYLDYEVPGPNPSAIVVFRPEQVKSASANVGTFDEEGTITNPTRRPQEFPFRTAELIRANYPWIWDAGGNIRGNDVYELWTRRKHGERSPEIDHWWEVERPAWIARHFNDHRLPGVIAQIKWGTVGRLGVRGMFQVVQDAVGRGR